jgi:hypothetical protein
MRRRNEGMEVWFRAGARIGKGSRQSGAMDRSRTGVPH